MTLDGHHAWFYLGLVESAEAASASWRQWLAIQARVLGYRTVQVGVTHLTRTDGISTGARPSVIFRTLLEIYRFHRKYRHQLREARERERAREIP